MHQRNIKDGSEWGALLRVPEAARELAISTRSVWRLIAAGELKAVRIGRAVRVSRESVLRVSERGAN